MNKNILIIVIFFLLMKLLTNSVDNLIIPTDAIRFRVIANSNSMEDQALKIKVRDNLQKEMFEVLKNSKTKEEANILIQTSLPTLEKTLKNSLKGTSETYKINYGMNYFPKKIYKGVEYPEGNYESLVVTLGDGLGDNWWCVLFPPLCLLEAEETEDTSEVEYKFFIQELLDNFNV